MDRLYKTYGRFGFNTNLLAYFKINSYICGMKKIINILATVSFLVFIVSFATFVISAFTGFYGNLMWSGLTSFVAFFVMLIVAGTPDNDTYLRNRRRKSS